MVTSGTFCAASRYWEMVYYTARCDEVAAVGAACSEVWLNAFYTAVCHAPTTRDGHIFAVSRHVAVLTKENVRLYRIVRGHRSEIRFATNLQIYKLCPRYNRSIHRGRKTKLFKPAAKRKPPMYFLFVDFLSTFAKDWMKRVVFIRQIMLRKIWLPLCASVNDFV